MKGGQEQLGPYRYRWPAGCFPLGRDSLALGAFATVRRGWRVCDLGCGAGVLLLLAARREAELTLTGVERDATAAQAARENLADNGLAGTVLTADWREVSLEPGHFDLIFSNPPYFAAGSGRSGGLARMEEPDGLASLCTCAGRLLRHGGRFALVQRPERLTDLLCALRGAGVEPKRLQFLQHSSAHPPSACLVEGVKGGRAGLEVLPAALTAEATS